MRRLINGVSILGLIAAPVSIGVVYAQPHALQTAAPQTAIAQENFPLNQAQLVTFQTDSELQRLSDRQRLDQLRDWLLLTVVSGKGLSSKAINQSLYDLPTARYGYMQPVANFEYGTTRSLYIGDGQVIALVPKSASREQQLDNLAQIVDRHRKDLGKPPTSVTVFEYDINSNQQTATLTRTQELDAKQLFTQESGYYEAEIPTADDLQTFMGQVDDVTFSQLKSGRLTLGGRKLHSRSVPKMAIADVAAIWQSEQNIQQRIRSFEAKWNAKIQDAPSQRDQIVQDAIAERKQLKLVNGSGFSLDPTYDFSRFQQVLAALKPRLQAMSQSGVITAEDIQRAETGIAAKNQVPYLELVDKLEKSSDSEVQRLGQLADLGELAVQYQTARYDGDLQGTEVGMVLFYTDLLAKIWALNYVGTTPTQAISDFIPLTRVKVSSIYAEEMAALPNTRLWFGTQDRGFQLADDGNQLLFGRNATRIYAAASNPLKPGVETTAAADAASFLDWWNDHYEEVARHEPQYDRLNQIMKWSLIINWLNQAKATNQLGFLQKVDVDRGHWFPDWVKAQGDRLRFQQWQQIKFFDRDRSNTPETMPLLMSDSSEPRIFRGGVSLADQSLFEARKPLRSLPEISGLEQRSNLDYSAIAAKDGELSFETLDKTAYKLRSIDNTLSESTAQAKAGTKFRSPQAELSGQAIQREVTQTQNRLQIDTQIGDTEFGTFSATKQKNGFVVGFLGRDLDDGLNLGLLLSHDKRPIGTILQNTSGIEIAMKSRSQPPEYLIKLFDSKRWLKVTEEAGGGGSQPPIKPPDQWDLRVGDLGDDSRKLRLVWIDDRAVQEQVATGSFDSIYRAAATEPVEDVAGFGDLWRNQQYRRMAKQIEVEPSGFIRFKQKYLKQELSKVDRDLSTGNSAKAAQRLDQLKQLYGAEPSIILRRAILELKQGRLRVKRIIPRESQNSKTFFDEINGLLEQQNIGFNRIETDNAFFYVQDSPSLNNQDWSVPIEQSVGSSGARVYQILPGDIPHAKFHVDGLNDASASAHSSTQFKGMNVSSLLNAQRNEDDRCEQPRDDTTTNPNQNLNCPQTKPVYVVISGS